MTKDSVDFVRQGAFIALGMILLEQSEASSPSLASTRSLYSRIVADKHEDPMAKLGAALGQGLIDAGGRNVTINLQSRAGSRNTNAIVGMVLFCQFWYWYPLAHCACLAFEPTGIIGLDGDLKVCIVYLYFLIVKVFDTIRCPNSSSPPMPNQVCSPTHLQRHHPRRRLLSRLQPLFCRQPPKLKLERRRKLLQRGTRWKP